jgi:hypothetical protein
MLILLIHIYMVIHSIILVSKLEHKASKDTVPCSNTEILTCIKEIIININNYMCITQMRLEEKGHRF